MVSPDTKTSSDDLSRKCIKATHITQDIQTSSHKEKDFVAPENKRKDWDFSNLRQIRTIGQRDKLNRQTD
jgi:hypothetical protein